MSKENVGVQTSLLSYQLSQIRTTGSITSAFFALYKFSDSMKGAKAIKAISIVSILVMSAVLILCSVEYDHLVKKAVENGDIPPERGRRLSMWTYISYLFAAAIIVASAILARL